MTYRKFQSATFTSWMVLLNIIILLIGAKYTNSENPLFNYLQDIFDRSKNHYLRRSKFFYFIMYCIILAISALDELLEFATTLSILLFNSYHNRLLLRLEKQKKEA